MAIQRMRARLLREGFPRVQMFILVSLTGLAGFGASVAMLAAGIDAMALRYLLAMGVAYIVFLLLLWLWLHTSAADYLDVGSFGSDGNACAKDGAGDFVIWSAPILFAEILVDALLATGLYRRLRMLEPEHWMLAALRRTVIPFVLTTLTVAAAGWGMQAYAPDARSLGEVLSSR